MNYHKAIANIKAVNTAGGSLTLNNDLLAGDEVGRLLMDSFGSDALELTDCTILEVEAAQASLQGKLSLFGKELPGTDKAILYLFPSYHPSTAPLAGTFSLSFSLQFPIQELFEKFFPLGGQLGFLFSDQVPDLAMKFLLDSTEKTWSASPANYVPAPPPIEALNAQLQIDGITFKVSNLGELKTGSVSLDGYLTFTDNATRLRLGVEIPTSGAGATFFLSPDHAPPSFANFFKHLLHKGPDFASLIPPPLTQFAQQIHFLGGNVLFSPKFVPKGFLLELGGAPNWSPIKDIVLNKWTLVTHLRKTGLSFLVEAEGNVFGHHLQGQITIDDSIAFRISNHNQGTTLTANQADSFLQGESWKNILPTSLFDAAKALSVEEINLQFTPKKGLDFASIVFTAEAHFKTGANTYSGGHLRMTLNYTAKPKSFHVEVEGKLEIGGYPIDIYAAYDKSQRDSGFSIQAHGGSAHAGKLIDNMGKAFGAVTLPDVLSELYIDGVDIEFDSLSGEFAFHTKGSMPVGAQGNGEAEVTISRASLSDSFEFHGHFQLLSRQFEFALNGGGNSGSLFASYSNSSGDQLVLRELVSYLSEDLAETISESLQITVKDIYLLYQKGQAGVQGKPKVPSKVLLGVELAGGVNLADLPVVGNAIPSDTKVAIKDLQFIVSSGAWTKAEVNALDPALPHLDVNSLYTPAVATTNPYLFVKGINIVAHLQIGSASRAILMSVGSTPPAPQEGTLLEAAGNTPAPSATPLVQSSPTNVTAQKPDEGTQWLNVQKGIGPVMLERVGVSFKKGQLQFLLDASLKMGPLTLGMEGLSVASPIDHFEPSFGLRGIAIDFKRNNLEIGGGLLKSAQLPHDVKFEYDGYALVRFKKLVVTALGSYAKLQDDSVSLFAYLAVDYPIGGPAWFFVTGLSAGFGVNRRLLIPELDKMDAFPLVSNVISGNSKAASGSNAKDGMVLRNQLSKLKTYVPIAKHENFIAVGVKFTSFKVLNGFALAVVSFGERFRVDLLGRLWMVNPPVDPKMLMGEASPLGKLGAKPFLVYMEVDLSASLIPEEGIFRMDGAIKPGSFVYSPLATIDGSFSFRGWFKGAHEGDFVFVLGGYHKNFKPPAHYPQPNKLRMLEMRYGISSRLYVNGKLYFALTPSAFMAGGSLSAVYNNSPFYANFNMYADFLITWKPYHYDISIGVEAHVKFSISTFFGDISFSASLGASLRVYGPEMSGRANVHFCGFSKSITFGSGNSSRPSGISWPEFEQTFLPKGKGMLSFVCEGGLIKNYEKATGNVWGVNRQEVRIGLNFGVPANQAQQFHPNSPASSLAKCLPNELHDLGRGDKFGLSPMHMAPEEVDSLVTISVKGHSGPVRLGHFKISPVFKPIPSALWGDWSNSSINQTQLLADRLMGLSITPGNGSTPSASYLVNSEALKYHMECQHVPFHAQRYLFKAWEQKGTPATIKAAIEADLPTKSNYDSLFQGLVDQEDLTAVNQIQGASNTFTQEIHNWHEIPAFGTLQA